MAWYFTGEMRWRQFADGHALVLQQRQVDALSGDSRWIDVPTVSDDA